MYETVRVLFLTISVILIALGGVEALRAKTPADPRYSASIIFMLVVTFLYFLFAEILE